MSTPLVLRSVLGKYNEVQPLKNGSVRSDRVRLDFVEVEPIAGSFRRMLRDWEFDLCEMAITTHAMARAFEKPVIGLPIVLHRGFHHSTFNCLKSSPLKGPADLMGKKVGVRAYSQTTGVWVRGILKAEYGLDHADVTWVTMEDAHVAEYRDPPNVVRAAPGKTLRAMLLAGEIDATIGLAPADTNEVRTVIPNADEAAAAWYRKTGIYPSNHTVVLRSEHAAANPWLAGELYRMFVAAKEQARTAAKSTPPSAAQTRLLALVGSDTLPYGMSANRASMEMLLRFAVEQKLIPRAYRLEELFDPALAVST
jgi:4,5-dihydroxyphthalate decarboxylase